MQTARDIGEQASVAGQMFGAMTPFAASAAAAKAGQMMGVSPLTVYHGSPHRFSKFDASKIGTGEGAQAYGRGLYFAESPDVANTYRAMQSPMPRLYKDGVPFEARTYAEMLAEARALGAGSVDEAIKRQAGRLEAGAKNGRGMALLETGGRSIEEERQIFDALRAIKAQGYAPGPGGNLYTVDLPDEKIAKMLDWDKPLSQQSSYVQEALKSSGLLTEVKNIPKIAAEKIKELAEQPGLADWAKRDLLKDANTVEQSPSLKHVAGVLKNMQLSYGISPDSGPFVPVAKNFLDFVKATQMVPNIETGGGALGMLEAVKGGPKEAAQALRQAGIPGIRYLDQGSRGAGKGTSNFVVFPGEEEALTILDVKKKGGAVKSSLDMTGMNLFNILRTV